MAMLCLAPTAVLSFSPLPRAPCGRSGVVPNAIRPMQNPDSWKSNDDLGGGADSISKLGSKNWNKAGEKGRQYEIHFEVAPGGYVTMKVEGLSGPACLEVTQPFIEQLGGEDAIEWQKPTAEMTESAYDLESVKDSNKLWNSEYESW